MFMDITMGIHGKHSISAANESEVGAGDATLVIKAALAKAQLCIRSSSQGQITASL